MASVVFFRAVNVGGHQKFQPSKLAQDMAPFDVVSIGAAGTFVVRARVSEARLREDIARRLPFQPEMMICTAHEVSVLKRAAGQFDRPGADAVQPFVTVLVKPPSPIPKLPYAYPGDSSPEVRIVAIEGRFVISLRQKGGAYSNAVVEKLLGVPATTRTWNTFVTVWKTLQPQ